MTEIEEVFWKNAEALLPKHKQEFDTDVLDCILNAMKEWGEINKKMHYDIGDRVVFSCPVITQDGKCHNVIFVGIISEIDEANHLYLVDCETTSDRSFCIPQSYIKGKIES